jgi:hypothetical protein
MAKNIIYTGTAEVNTAVGKLTKGMVIELDDQIAENLARNYGFKITKSEATHEFKKDLDKWVPIKKEKKK